MADLHQQSTLGEPDQCYLQIIVSSLGHGYSVLVGTLPAQHQR